jgi:hypothetical protein
MYLGFGQRTGNSKPKAYKTLRREVVTMVENYIRSPSRLIYLILK